MLTASTLVLVACSGKFPPIPAHYSDDLKALVEALIKKEPESRPDMQQILELDYVRTHMKAYSQHIARNITKRQLSFERSLTQFNLRVGWGHASGGLMVLLQRWLQVGTCDSTSLQLGHWHRSTETPHCGSYKQRSNAQQLTHGTFKLSPLQTTDLLVNPCPQDGEGLPTDPILAPLQAVLAADAQMGRAASQGSANSLPSASSATSSPMQFMENAPSGALSSHGDGTPTGSPSRGEADAILNRRSLDNDSAKVRWATGQQSCLQQE